MKKTFLEPDWDKLNLSDDFFFGYAMRKPDICKEFLEILLRASRKTHFRDFFEIACEF